MVPNILRERLLEAMQEFGSVSPEQTQVVMLENALLSRKGLYTNDPAPKYSLRSLPGQFTDLHLVSEINLGHDMDFGLSKGYSTARKHFTRKA